MTGVPAFPELTTRLQLRFADLNAAGHVANTAIAVLFDEARVRTLGYPMADGSRVGGGLVPPGRSTLLGQQTLEYTRELFFRGQDVEVRSWVSGIGGSRFALSSALLDGGDAAGSGEGEGEGEPDVVALADCTIVVIDTATGRPAPLTEEHRARLLALSAPPVPLRSRLVTGLA